MPDSHGFKAVIAMFARINGDPALHVQSGIRAAKNEVCHHIGSAVTKRA